MAYALVGSAGTASVSTSGGNVTPAYGAGSSRTANNLLLCFVSGTSGGSTVLTYAAPSGWLSTANLSDGAGNAAVSIFYKIAAGSDAAPTITGLAGFITAVHLEEWSGGEFSGGGSIPLDQTGNAGSSSSPLTVILNNANLLSGELVAMVGADRRSVARASNDTWTSNHGTPTLQASNNGVSSVDHYSHATLISNSNSGADNVSMTLSITTSITSLLGLAASFQVIPPPADNPPVGYPKRRHRAMVAQ